MEIKLHRQAAEALLARARGWEWENACRELVNGDDGMRAEVEACVEIVGRLTDPVNRWPQDTLPNGLGEEDRAFVTVDLTDETLDWIERERRMMAQYVADLDAGEAAGLQSGTMADEVYRLHVLDGIVRQREAARESETVGVA